MKKIIWLIVSLLVVFMTAGCDMEWEESEIELDELIGKWYNPYTYELVFEITKAGEGYKGYIAKTEVSCTITADNSTVSFFGLDEVSRGSFRCSINNGTLMIKNNGTKDFSDLTYNSWLVKSDRILDGDSVRVELVGKWYSDTFSFSTPNFVIFRTGKITISGAEDNKYTVLVLGTTINVYRGNSSRVGSFQYSIENGKMRITNETGICEGLQDLSPFVKQGTEEEEDEDEEDDEEEEVKNITL